MQKEIGVGGGHILNQLLRSLVKRVLKPYDSGFGLVSLVGVLVAEKFQFFVVKKTIEVPGPFGWLFRTLSEHVSAISNSSPIQERIYKKAVDLLNAI